VPLGSNTPPPAIPGFEFVRTLGAGGFSDVYLYQQKMPRRQVAIKVLHIDGLDRTLRRQFVAEANLMAQLSSHPAIATIYAAEITENAQPYLVMEYCSGGSLGAAYKAAPLPVAEVLRVGIRVSSALEAAHRLGIVHRDIKPANILVTDYGLPVLTDFGISIGDDGIGDSTMFSSHEATTEASGSSHGLSIPWAPPEAFADEPVGTAQSDVFSLAATMFTLLEGRSPFEVRGAKNGPVQLSRRIETGAINPAVREDVPESLRAALAIGMATNPADRYPSALAFADALQLVQAELGQPVTQIELPVALTGAIPIVPTAPAPDLAQTVLPEESVPELATIMVDRAQAPAPVDAPVPVSLPLPAAQPVPESVIAPAAVPAAEPAPVPVPVPVFAPEPVATQPPAAAQPPVAAQAPAAAQPPVAVQPPVAPAPVPPAAAAAAYVPPAYTPPAYTAPTYTPPANTPPANTAPVAPAPVAPVAFSPTIPPVPPVGYGTTPPLPPKRSRRKVILISAIAAVLVLGIAGGAAAMLIPRDTPVVRADDDDEDEEDSGNSGATPLCDVDYLKETADLWEVTTSSINRYAEGTDDISLTAGLDRICGFSVPESPYYNDYAVQEIYLSTDGSEEDVDKLLAVYSNCEEPTDWSTFTSWTCSTGTLFVSIRQYTEDASYSSPEAVGDDPYFQVISYTYE